MEGIFDRTSMNVLSKKMLEQNNFSEGQFQTIKSSFEPKKSYRVTQSTFGNAMNESMKGSARLLALNDTQASVMKKSMSKEGGITLNSLLQKNGTLRGSQSAA